MKLAEALIQRADRQKKIHQLRQRLMRSARVQEDEQPPEDPQALLAELRQALDDLAALIKRINKTNLSTELGDGLTLTDALAERDILVMHRNVLSSLIEAAIPQQPRFGRSEIKFYSTVDVSDVQKQIDDLARQHRELDSRIQAINWETELIED